MAGEEEARPAAERSYAAARAARELELRRSEFELAVLLGCVRSFPDGETGRRRVTVTEIGRLRAARGFPHALRERVQTVGTARGAALMRITEARFTRLARAGLLVPIGFYLNRYQCVVWHYLTDDLRQFGQANPALLTGRAPETMRSRIEAGEDSRARNWRARHSGFLLRLTEGGWARAAIPASMLPQDQLEDVVPDPWERAHLYRLRPRLASVSGAQGSPSARRAAALQVADDPDEVRWLLATLGLDLEEARSESAAPRPTGEVPAAALPPGHSSTLGGLLGQDLPGRGMFGWLRRRRERPGGEWGRPRQTVASRSSA
ncbi:hypothetical protein DSC45_31460 [Streptomyces sp. YIM 130001]|uniref:DUF6397 family protein n=1 Tax=Streptomyces sp. YIM 130001 TaxID=2259644 RepID=UPI000E654B29|nr:DUF6397 family protein [Streptomyces sp. YIM 130001]RII09396.1 hypothetical protein DSC45_31460 [Streptomyces sp. YIM 130001]